MLHDELQYFIDHQNELVEQYQGKVLVIKDQVVVGVFQTPLEALEEPREEHELGTFLIQPCHPGPEAYTITLSPQSATL